VVDEDHPKAALAEPFAQVEDLGGLLDTQRGGRFVGD
jgi:hypothetical protein